MRRTWVQDCFEVEAQELLARVTERNYGRTPDGSFYEIGESQSNSPNLKGLWFIDPTAKGGIRYG